jgi:DNA-binding GntR family transcriptional regulator
LGDPLPARAEGRWRERAAILAAIVRRDDADAERRTRSHAKHGERLILDAMTAAAAAS